MVNISDQFICTNNYEVVNQETTAQMVVEQPTIPHLIDKLADVALKNEGSGLVFSSGVATALIIYVIAKSLSEVIKAWRSSNNT